jgi:hypothetical protein
MKGRRQEQALPEALSGGIEDQRLLKGYRV